MREKRPVCPWLYDFSKVKISLSEKILVSKTIRFKVIEFWSLEADPFLPVLVLAHFQGMIWTPHFPFLCPPINVILEYI